MSPDDVIATRTYLEMTDSRALRAGRVRDVDARVARRDDCEPGFWRYLYSTVGEAYQWVDRLPWTEEEIRPTCRTPPSLSGS